MVVAIYKIRIPKPLDLEIEFISKVMKVIEEVTKSFYENLDYKYVILFESGEFKALDFELTNDRNFEYSQLLKGKIELAVIWFE